MSKNLFCLGVAIIGIYLLLSVSNFQVENYDPAIFKRLFNFTDFGGKYVLIEKNGKLAFLGYNDEGFNMIILKSDGIAVHISDLKGIEEQDWKWKKKGDYVFELTTSAGKNVGTLKME